jgi:hypothetical protein
MFYQEADTISVFKLPGLYRAQGFTGEPLEKLTYARKVWVKYLKQDSTLVSRDKTYTNEEVVNLILFGDRAHIDLDRRARYDSWYSNVGSRAILETRFADIVEFLSTGIFVLRDLHSEALAALPPITEAEDEVA